VYVCVCMCLCVCVCVWGGGGWVGCGAWGGLWRVSKECVNCTVSVLWNGLICVSVVTAGCGRCQIIRT